MCEGERDDAIRRAFRSYKDPDCDLSAVINTRCRECTERLRPVPLVHDEEMLTNPKMEAFTMDHHPGLFIVRNGMSQNTIKELFKAVYLRFPVDKNMSSKSVRCNLEDLDKTQKSVWEAQTETGIYFIDKLRWITLGYHFKWTEREYVEDFCTDLPKLLHDIAVEIVSRIGEFPNFTPDTAIVNYYHRADRIAFHQDEFEWDMSKPLVSISIGLPGLLLIGDDTPSTAPDGLLLNSGDIIIMSGSSRTSYHAVPRVFATCHVSCPNHRTRNGVTSGERDWSDNSGVKRVYNCKKSGARFVTERKRCQVCPDIEDLIGSYDDYEDEIRTVTEIPPQVFYKRLTEFASRTRVNMTVSCKLEIPFPSNRYAAIAMKSVTADKEPRKSGTKREMWVNDSILTVTISSSELRLLRVAVGSCLDLLKLSIDTMDMFDDK